MSKFVSNLFSIEGKVVILTGGAGYLGRQYVEGLAQAGALVIIFDLAEPKGVLHYAGAYRVDITDPAAVAAKVTEVHNTFGRIDCLVNNAAMNPAVGDPNSAKMSGPYENHPTELWRQEVEVNLNGMQFTLQAVAPHMMRAGQGTIVNIASEVSTIAYDWTDVYPDGKFKSAAYIATKTAAVGLTRAWAAYLGVYGVRVNAFSPGGMQTGRMPPGFVEAYGKKNMLKSMAQPGDYVGHLIFLLSDASARMTGHNLIADGGKSAW